jgi:1-acyl-sn-glycerol-3-phosphate acyltransferase
VLYQLLKAYARVAIRLYCREVRINKPASLELEGPLLLACNHPNSFLDGVVLTTLMEHDLYSLARGDAFRGSFMNKTLRRIRLLPVFRTSEGTENLEQNYRTFASCIEVFRNRKIVLIFSEGGCRNEWRLRSLRKGTARLAHTAWNSGIPLKVLPVGINYNSFKKFGKDVHIFFGEPFGMEVMAGQETHGKQLLAFNQALQSQLKELVYEINEKDKEGVEERFPSRIPFAAKAALFLPALAGILLHAPLYLPIKAFTHLRFRTSEHYDSMLTALLMMAYPLYVAAVVILLSLVNIWLGLPAIVLLPFTAWCLSKTNFLRI